MDGERSDADKMMAGEDFESRERELSSAPRLALYIVLHYDDRLTGVDSAGSVGMHRVPARFSSV